MRRWGPPLRFRALSALSLALIVGFSSVAINIGPSAGADADPAAVTRDAAEWLLSELRDGGGSLEHLGRADWGLTADALIALGSTDEVTTPVARNAAAQMVAHRGEFVTWDEFGDEFPGVVLAGPLAKTLLVAQIYDAPAAERAAMEAQLRALIVPDGADAGRVADHNPFDVDTSSSFTEALAVAALGRTDGGVPASVLNHLLAQQCPAGGFRLALSGGTCSEDAVIDTDATAMVTQALLGVAPNPTRDAAVARAAAWLDSVQMPSGAFGGTGPTAAANTNSSALAAQALRAAGHLESADRAAAWVAALQRVDVTTDRGAIAYDRAAADAAADEGIEPLARDQWRRATTQGVMAFGAPVIGLIGVPSSPPVTTTTSAAGDPTSTTTTTTVATTTTTPVATTTPAADGPSTTIDTASHPTTTLPEVEVSATNTDERVDVLAATRRSSAASAALPRTGGAMSELWGLGLAMIAAGLLLGGVPRRR